LNKAIPAWLLAAFLLAPLPSPAQTVGEPHYDSQLMRLAEILGSLHFLRNLCGDKGSQWRDRMQRMITMEKPDAKRKARLYGAFNTAYQAFSEHYHQCTPAAREAIRRYEREGAALSQKLVERYGN